MVRRAAPSSSAAWGASSDELAAARASLKSALLANSRTPNELASTLGRYQLIEADRLSIEKDLGALSTVTPEDARRALGRYLRAVSLAAAGGGERLDEASLLAIVPQATSDGGL